MNFKILERIKIADNEIDIKNQFTLILGKFKKEQINSFQEFNTYDLLEDFNDISFEKLITIFKSERNNGDFPNFAEILDLFLNTTEFHIQIIEKYSELTQFFIQSLQLRISTNENEKLEKLLEI